MAQQQTSITDTRDAILEAQADTMELVREVMQEIATPQIKLESRKLWATLPDEAKERFKYERPQEYQEFMKG